MPLFYTVSTQAIYGIGAWSVIAGQAASTPRFSVQYRSSFWTEGATGRRRKNPIKPRITFMIMFPCKFWVDEMSDEHPIGIQKKSKKPRLCLYDMLNAKRKKVNSFCVQKNPPCLIYGGFYYRYAFKISALSVFSQVNSSFSRPKCPYEADFLYRGFKRSYIWTIPFGRRSNCSRTMLAIFSSESFPVP